MGADAVAKLPELIAQYPYCATYRLLYVIALANVHSTRLQEEVKRQAIALPERTKLFQLINNGEYEWISLMHDLEEARRNAPEVNDFEIIERFLSNAENNQGDTPTYCIDELAAAPALPVDEEAEDSPLLDIDPSQDELIDNFLQAEAEGTLFVPKAEAKEMNEDDSFDIEKISDRAFLTESLAKVYVKQHKYEQALAIFLELNLKYPKKNCYFADQIRYLEKVIEYKKQAETANVVKENNNNQIKQ